MDQYLSKNILMYGGPKSGKTLAMMKFQEFLRVSDFNMKKKKIGGKTHKFTLTGPARLYNNEIQ